MGAFKIVKLIGQGLNNTVITGGLVPKGAYNAGTDYAVGDSVDYNGSSYVMHTDAAAGTVPTNTTYWQVLANKGDTGATGATGAAGADGADGQGVPTGGTTGQILSKIDGTDYNTEWTTAAGTGDMLASVYDPQAIAGDAFDTDNHISGTTNKVFTATEQTKLSNIEALADVTDAGNVGSSIHGATAKVTPVDADTMPLIDSAASNVLKKVTWANIKATIQAAFDLIYAPIAKGVTNGDSHDHSGGDGAQIDHTTLSNIGTNSHSTIDSHIGSTSNPHSVTANQVLPTQTGNSGKYLTTDGSNSSWGTVSASPGGSNTQLQYNNSGSFGGAEITYSSSGSDRILSAGANNLKFTSANLVQNPSALFSAYVNTGDNGIYIDSTATEFDNLAGLYKFVNDNTFTAYGILNFSNLATSDKTFTFPNTTGTLALTSDLSTYAPLTSPTFATSITGSYLTASEMLITDASKNIVSAPVATYPSLTELTYLKGVTSAIQTQINAKAPTASPTFTGTVTLPTGLTGVIRADSGVVSVDTDVTDIVTAASDTAAGKVELATAGETTTGTDTGRAVTPDSLAGSDYGKRVVSVIVSDPNGDALTTGDGKAYIRINSVMNGYNLVAVAAHVTTVSSSGNPTVQIHNVTDAQDMLSTALTIDANEKDSKDATTAAVINATYDDVATGDELRIDVDTAGTGTKGLIVDLTFSLP